MSIYGIIDEKVLKGVVDSAAVGMDVTDDNLRAFIEQFKKYPETSVVVVNFYQAKLAIELCEGSQVQACIAIAYPPLCSVPTELKVSQARYAVEKLGVKHVLFTIDHSKFKEGKVSEVQSEIEEVVKAVNDRAEVIVMPDFSHWNLDDSVKLAKIISDAGGDIIKSTGGLGRKEDPKKIAAAVNAVNGSIKIMGTSAIRDLDDTLGMLDARPDKIAISRAGFFTTLDEIHVLEAVRLNKEELAGYLCGLVWHPTCTEADLHSYLEEAQKAKLYGVNVDPRWVPAAKEHLNGSDTKVISRVDTPFGISPKDLKVEELEWIIKNGPKDIEIQVAMNTAAFKSGQYEYVDEELSALVKIAGEVAISVILQTPLLTKDETVAAVMLCRACGVRAVEPIHGFGKFSEDGSVIYPEQLKKSDISLLKQIGGKSIKVRATGGIDRTIQVLSMIHGGAELLFVPNAVDLVDRYDALVERVSGYSKL
jgi:deoxyribose-phosphate aldolase